MEQGSFTWSAAWGHGSLILLALFHLAWTGLVTGGATAAVAVDALGGPRFRGRATVIASLGRPGLLTVAWLEVTASLLLVLARILYPRFAPTGAYWAGVLLPLAAGLGLIGLFRSLLEDARAPALRVAAGLAGIGLLVASYLLLWSGAGTLLRPESWFTVEPPWRFLASWSGSGRFVEFTLLSLAMVGVAVAALAERAGEGEEARLLRRLGGWFALALLVAWPVATLFTHLNLPAIALSPGVWGTAGLGVVLAGATSWALSARLGGEAAVPRALAVAPLALLALVVAGDHLTRVNALQEIVVAGLEPPPPRIERPAAAPKKEVEAGKAVFDRVCSICHRFDARRVGPPLDAVLPKYRKDPEALKAFLRAPVKKDPAYPPMPKPAIDEAEIQAVATYVLERVAR